MQQENRQFHKRLSWENQVYVDNEYPLDSTLTKLGEKSDQASESGNYAEALQGYQTILDSMLQKKDIDTFLLAKLTLGKLLALFHAKKIVVMQEVNARMADVCKYSLDSNSAILPQALSNWYRFLQNVFSEAPHCRNVPEEVMLAFKEQIAAYGENIQLMPVNFPSPSPWLIDW